MKNIYLYNTSDVGYMDEEWIDYDPKKTEAKIKVEIEIKETVNEEQVEEI